MKLGIIRCNMTMDTCPGTKDFKAIKEKTGVFKDVEGSIELVGFNSCGGCCGRKAVDRAGEMIRRGANTIAFSTCVTKPKYSCPFIERMRGAVEDAYGDKIEILDYTH